MRTIAVLGDGGWGTALALLLRSNGHRVRVWGAFPDYVRVVAKTRRNARFLPGIVVPRDIRVTSDLAEALTGCDLVVSAVPSQFVGSVMERIRREHPPGAGVTFVSVSKGIDAQTLKRCSQTIRTALPRRPVCVLSGPSHAEEVARGLPASVVAASTDPAVSREVQGVFGGTRFRVYASKDPAGVELGGALKNVIALAAGISDGLRLGDNAKAALLTRGVVEIARLGARLGAKRATFWGLSCLGDLLTTAYSPHGRNLRVGRLLGRNRSLESILAGMSQVAEGVETSRAVHRLSRSLAVDLPISLEVYRILFEGKSPRRALADLMGRAQTKE